MSREECFYCGDDTQEMHRDHVRPVSMSSTYRSYDPSDTVMACRECNMSLGGAPVATLEERSAYLIERYLSKYKGVLNTPNWTEGELSEMGVHNALKNRGQFMHEEVC